MSELLKKQKFGVEVEFTGITRTMAAEAVAEILGSHATGPDRTCYRTSALPYTPHEMENAMHPYELPQIHYTVVRVAKGQMGIGGDDSWGAYTHQEYLLNADGKMEFSFSFKGI